MYQGEKRSKLRSLFFGNDKVGMKFALRLWNKYDIIRISYK